MKISIIIPAYNEAANIGRLVDYLFKNGSDKLAEIIVCDGSSTDNTVEKAKAAGAHVVSIPCTRRSAQMNHGATIASGEILYFIHADTFPAASYVEDISIAIAKGFQLGRYKTKFLSSKPLLRFNEWFTRFDFFICMGGDQTLFITTGLFKKLNGFRQDMQIMEEYEFCKRAREHGRYVIMNGSALVSARKYDKNSWLQVQLTNYKVVQMYNKGASHQSIIEHYNKKLRF
jgi:rSAM/selenodomain-associated transferase 2